MSTIGRVALGVLVTLAVWTLPAQRPAWAQDNDEWSFVLTPQVWLSHIAKNGFSSPPNGGLIGGFVINTSNFEFVSSPFPAESKSKNEINPQFGIQFAAQKGRLTLAGAFQFVDFSTYNDITFVHPEGITICFPPPPGPGLPPGNECVSSGQKWAREIVDTTRIDIDLAASYFFPHVVPDRLHASLGAGFKFIYASATRRHAQLSPAAAFMENSPHGILGTTGIYTTCGDPCNSPFTFRNEVKQKSYVYGLTIPMNVTTQLTRDASWLLPLSVSPMIGGETRDDYNVVYSQNLPPDVRRFRFPLDVNRLDGTTFAYGVTADASVRWIISESLSAYAGFRVQYIKGHEQYLAYGPLLGMSYRFGAR